MFPPPIANLDLGVPLVVVIVGIILLVARFQRHRGVRVAVYVFAAAASALLAYQLLENPPAAVLLAILAMLLTVQLLFDRLCERGWKAFKSWWASSGRR